MRALWAVILNRKFCACVNSRRKFWTTNLKSSVSQVGGHKKAMGITHAHILVGNLNGESHACADSRRFFVATYLKTPVAI